MNEGEMGQMSQEEVRKLENFKRLSKILGVHLNTLERVYQRPNFQKFVIRRLKDFQDVGMGRVRKDIGGTKREANDKFYELFNTAVELGILQSEELDSFYPPNGK